MKTTIHPDHVGRTFRESLGACSLCLMVLLAAACSVDLGKLRPAKVLDGSMDRPIGNDAVEAASDNSDASDGGVDADSAAAVPDLPGAGEAGLPSDATHPPRMDVAMDVAMDVIALRDVAEALDLPITGEDTGGADVGIGGAGTGGSGGVRATGGTSGGGTGGTGGTGGIGTGGGAGGSGGAVSTGGTGGAGGADPDLVLWYRFDESSGTTATDSATPGGSPNDGRLMTYGTSGGSASFTTDSRVGTRALRLTPSSISPSSAGGYVVMPALQPLAPNALTIAVWVKLAAASSAQDWARILDCATDDESTGPFFYLTARSTATGTPVRFGISQTGHAGDVVQRLDGKALTANVWYHIVIVLPAGSPYTGTLYMNGEPVGTNNTMTLHLSDLAITTNNWLGRSEFSADPFFNGWLDDFRVYKRALSQQEVTALFSLR